MRDSIIKILKSCVCTLALILPGALSTLGTSDDGNHVTYIFRYDDYSSKSPTAFEEKLIQLFKKVEIPLTVGVVPYVVAGDWNDPASTDTLVLSENKIRILTDAALEGTVEIALHGYSHGRLATAPDGESSEFMGVDVDIQCERIRAGKEFLERATGTRITSFIPPHNRYDAGTLQCLEQEDFLTVSADLTGSSHQARSIRFFPFISGKFPQLKQAHEAAIRQVSDNPVVVVMMHPADFIEAGPSDDPQISLNELEELLKNLKSQLPTRFSTFERAAMERPDFGGERLHEYQTFINSFLYRASPGFLRRIYWPERFYPSRHLIAQAEKQARLYVPAFFGFALLAGAIAFLLIDFLLRRSAGRLRWALIALIAGGSLSAIAAFLYLWNIRLPFLCLMIALVSGLAIGRQLKTSFRSRRRLS